MSYSSRITYVFCAGVSRQTPRDDFKHAALVPGAQLLETGPIGQAGHTVLKDRYIVWKYVKKTLFGTGFYLFIACGIPGQRTG
jgi:hypothetical protein